MKRRTGTVFIVIGFALMVAALVLTVYNLWDSRRAGEASKEILTSLEKQLDRESVTFPTDNPDREMPTVKIDGYRYLGKLKIPDLDIEVPVMDKWDYDRLLISPCRYSGSVYKNNMVIAAHNYSTHFGNIQSLQPDSKVIFTDVEKNVYKYKVLTVETLSPHQTDELETPTKSDPWDLTLFTCTYDGSRRCTIRCEKIK